MSTSVNDTLANPSTGTLKTVKRAASTLVNGTTLFTITGGPIIVRQLVAVCKTANNTTASTLTFNIDPDGAAVSTAITTATTSLASAAVGTLVYINTSYAGTIVANGVGVSGVGELNLILPEGIITAVVGVGSTTGTWEVIMNYESLGGVAA